MLYDARGMARKTLGEGRREDRAVSPFARKPDALKGVAMSEVSLTSEGEALAMRLALEGSTVARVALTGAGVWPIAYVETAIRTINREALAREAS